MNKSIFMLTLCLFAFMVVNAQESVSPAGEFPIVEEPITLDVLVLGHAIVEDFSTNTFTNWYSEKTGINLDLNIAPPTEAEAVLNLTLASGDLPDVIVGFTVNPSTLALFGAQGLFLPLNDLIDEQGFFIKEVFETSPQVEGLIRSPDGVIYGLPQVNECFHCFHAQRAFINQDWLDAVGMDMPQTTEDFFNVLTAFSEQDANGNGDPNDEIPLAAATTGWNTNVDGFLMNPFAFSEFYSTSAVSNRFLDMNEQTISTVVNTEGWREGLRYLNRLYEAGLLSQDSFTQPVDQVKQLVEGGDTPAVGVIISGAQPDFANIGGERWLSYAVIPPLAGPTGLRQSPYNPWGVGSGECVINANTEYPEAAFRWCDGLYDRETTLRSVFGLPDEQWKWAEDGALGINNEAAVWQRLSTFGTLQNVHWAQRGPSYRPRELRLGEARGDNPATLSIVLYEETNEKMVPYARDVEDVIPPLAFTTDQAAELTELRLAINDFVNQMTAEFALGRSSLDTDWDRYVETLDSLGVDRMVEIYQEAYDTQFGN